MSLNSKILGEEIKRIRKSKRMTQSELSDGICTQATISGIESGRTFPSIDILYYLSLRLQVSMDYFFEKITFRQEQYVNETYSYAEQLVKQDNFKELLELTNFELNRTSGYKDPSLDLYLRWQRAICSYELKEATWEQCVCQLQNLLDSNHYSIKQQFMNIRIKNSMANVLANNEKYIEALSIFNEILNEEINMDGYHRMRLKVYFNLSKLYYVMEDYKKSHHYALEGIRISLKMEDLSVLGPLYVQAGQSLFRQKGNQKTVSTFYDNALFLFRLYGREDYIQVVEKLIDMLDAKCSVERN
ncbi:helix-turn-helix domain-containing protein [Sutcliffiella horikoshii]|uniref:helix-turn-helix domain-containing protein n=1 Tax=Sutcliffiella horikoshii TaxID=79883 RepID=UPI003CFADEEE